MKKNIGRALSLQGEGMLTARTMRPLSKWELSRNEMDARVLANKRPRLGERVSTFSKGSALAAVFIGTMASILLSDAHSHFHFGTHHVIVTYLSPAAAHRLCCFLARMHWLPGDVACEHLALSNNAVFVFARGA